MITRYRFSFNGQQLDQLLVNDYGAKALIITDIRYAEPGFAKTVETTGAIDGGLIIRNYRQKASVTVEFLLRIYDVAQRNAAVDRIKTWAKATASVVTSDKTGKTLRNCVCEVFPEVGSARDWSKPLSITFSSYVFPYWEESTQTSYTATGTNLTGSMNVPGNAPKAYAEVNITPQSGTMKECVVQLGSTTIKLTGISIAASGTANYLRIDTDANSNIRIRKCIGGTWTSLLADRTTDSSDELVAVPGQSNVVKANAGSVRIKVEMKVRGAWI